MKRNTLNYWVDVGIGCAFVLSAISGLVFLLPVESLDSQVLGLGYPVWNALHTWSSLALIAGVLIHLVLHWKWIVGMTQRMVMGHQTVQPAACARVGKPAPLLSRRRFLALGLTAVAAGICAVGGALIGAGRLSDAGETITGDRVEDGSGEPAPTGVACPRGMINDPYPGHCRHYTDRNGDGICDYSVPGSGYN